MPRLRGAPRSMEPPALCHSEPSGPDASGDKSAEPRRQVFGPAINPHGACGIKIVGRTVTRLERLSKLTAEHAEHAELRTFLI